MTWSLKSFLGLSTDASADNLNQLRSNLLSLRDHTHTGVAGDGALLLGGVEYLQLIPWYPQTNVGFGTLTISTGSGSPMNAILTTDNTNPNNECTFPISLKRGTWNLNLIGRTNNSSGIASIYLDAALMGTIDFYSAGANDSANLSLTGFTVSALPIATGQTLRILMATKNASSGGYGCGLRFLQFRRTGA